MGLVAIFAAAPIPIFIMGSLLEASKLVVASWLYRSWKEVPLLLKTYFTMALIVLMVLTSMGIFGYLSKAHLDQAIPSGDVAAKLSLIDEKIKTEKENLNANRKELTQLDQQVDQTIARTDDAKGTERAIAIRRGQQKERARILTEIGTTQTKIAKLNEERAPIATEVRKVEAEVGPIKYIAALIYEDNPETDVLEKAVRWVIIMIVIVFDPLAVLMLVAANWQQKKDKEDVVEHVPAYVAEVTMPEPIPEPESDPEESNKWEKFTDKLKWSNVFTKPVPLPTDAKEIMSEFFQKDEVKSTKPIEYDSAGRRITPMTAEESRAKTIAQDVEDLQKPV
jgi:flagellar basal body-associated protein FliL